MWKAIAFVLWPLPALLAALRRINDTQTKILATAFSALIGYRLAITDPRFDSYRYAENFLDLSALDWSSFTAWFRDNCFYTEACLEPALPFIGYAASRLTDGYHLPYATFGAIFGFFCISTLAAIKEHNNHYWTKLSYIALLCLYLLNPIQNINGLRFYIATWVFLIAIINLHFGHKKIGLLQLFCAPLFHYSFLGAGILAILLIPLRIPTPIAATLALVSYTVSTPAAWILSKISGGISLGITERGARYLNEDYVFSRDQLKATAFDSYAFLQEYSTLGLDVWIALLCAFLLITRRHREVTPTSQHFLRYSLLTFATFNTLRDVPSMTRFSIIGIMMAIISLINLIPHLTKTERVTIVALLALGTALTLPASLRLAAGIIDINTLLPSAMLLADRTSLL